MNYLVLRNLRKNYICNKTLKKLTMKRFLLSIMIGFTFVSNAQKKSKNEADDSDTTIKKELIYEIVPRVFGNKIPSQKPWGTSQENGVGKFNDITDLALQQIKELGATYIWYSGVLEHSSLSDFSSIGVDSDDPDIVKGRAGNLFAIKDYYDVDPDLAQNPIKRLEEFTSLIDRTHKNNLKVIIDIVPNYVARNYKSQTSSKKRPDFGADDATSEYNRNNNFYYVQNTAFFVPIIENYKPLNGENHSLLDGKFAENPAKWSGSGSAAMPNPSDSFDVVKLNFGQNNGQDEFPELPVNFDMQPVAAHLNFWKDKDVPDTWKKFKDIALFWMDKGVDGFRFANADQVPVAFWSYLNSAIKVKYPDAFLLGEVNDEKRYRQFIRVGKMDYVYDKNGLYAKQAQILKGKIDPDQLVYAVKSIEDISANVVNFIENHDLNRIASAEFGSNGHKAKPLMTIATTISASPTIIYFGQEVGEPAKQESGFGKANQTSLYDYTNVPNHQRWMNDGKFDGAKLKFEEKLLRDFYQRLLRFSAQSNAIAGEYEQLQTANKDSKGYDADIFSFVRFSDNEKLLIVVNYSDSKSSYFDLKIPTSVILKMKLRDGNYIIKDQLYGKSTLKLTVDKGQGSVTLTLAPSESFIYQIK